MATSALSMGCGWPGFSPSYIRSPILKSGFLATILESGSWNGASLGRVPRGVGPETIHLGQNLETVKQQQLSDV